MTPEVATEFLSLDQEQSFDCEKKKSNAGKSSTYKNLQKKRGLKSHWSSADNRFFKKVSW